MGDEFIEFERCRDQESADDVTRVLSAAGIAYKVGSDEAEFDMSMLGSTNDEAATTIVSLARSDYERAREAMEAESLNSPLPEGHYLLDSSDEELAEVVGKSSEWSAYDVAHARRLVQERGIDLAQIEAKRLERRMTLEKGKRASFLLVFSGWAFLGLSHFWMLAVFAAVGVGWSLAFMNEKTPEGNFYTYDVESRSMGRLLFFLSLLAGARLAYLLVTN